MTESKLIFLDIDGTLLKQDKTVPESAYRAIELAQANGHKIFINTGRAISDILPVIKTINYDGIICSNGTYVEIDGEVIFQQNLSNEHVNETLNWLNDNGVEYYSECKAGIYASENFIPRIAEIHMGGDTSENREIMIKNNPKLILGENTYRDDVFKICFVCPEHITMDDMNEQFDKEFQIYPWSIGDYCSYFGELSQKGYTKANAMARVMEHYGAKLEDTIAFGDGPNDMEMIQFCGTGVAMGNATEDLKQVADLVTKPITEDGIYHGFEVLELI